MALWRNSKFQAAWDEVEHSRKLGGSTDPEFIEILEKELNKQK